MMKSSNDPEAELSLRLPPGAVLRHAHGLSYRVLEDAFLLHGSELIPALRYVQLEEGGMRVGEVWTRATQEMQSPTIFTHIGAEDPQNPSDGITPLPREADKGEPRLGEIIDDQEVVGYGYDVTGYESTGEFSKTIRFKLLTSQYGLPIDTVIERMIQ